MSGINVSAETELESDKQHKSSREVAEYMRTVGSDVGRNYKTHGDVWRVSEEVQQTGLLHLILDKLEELAQRPNDPLMAHRNWLLKWRSSIVALIDEYRKQKKRLLSMFGEDVDLGSDVSREYDIDAFIYYWRHDRLYHRFIYDRLQDNVKRLKSVKTPKDIVNLSGIGKRKAEKILQALSINDAVEHMQLKEG